MKENKLNTEIQSTTTHTPKQESSSLSTTSIVIVALLAIGAVFFIKKVIDTKKMLDRDRQSRYKVAKLLIDEAIELKQWDFLEIQLNSTTTQDFPDLIAMIKEALKNKPKD